MLIYLCVTIIIITNKTISCSGITLFLNKFTFSSICWSFLNSNPGAITSIWILIVFNLLNPFRKSLYLVPDVVTLPKNFLINNVNAYHYQLIFLVVLTLFYQCWNRNMVISNYVDVKITQAFGTIGSIFKRKFFKLC